MDTYPRPGKVGSNFGSFGRPEGSRRNIFKNPEEGST